MLDQAFDDIQTALDSAASDYPTPRRQRIAIAIPVFNDWCAVSKLLQQLDVVLLNDGRTADVFLIDDASTTEPQNTSLTESLTAITRVERICLRRNLGHQRAIAIALAYLERHETHDAIVIMDGDGEDDPADVPVMLRECEKHEYEKIVFAARMKRSESLRFRIGYLGYRALHWLLTGRGCRVGNFSVIPRRRLESLTVVSETWNHYSAAAFASRQPYVTVPSARAKRLDGQSHMNFVRLVMHGLSAISVYAETVGVRLLCASAFMMVVALLGACGAIAVSAFSQVTIPSWVVSAVGVLSVILLQVMTFSLLFSFSILAGRNSSTILPARDFQFFVRGVTPLGRIRPRRRTADTSAPAKSSEQTGTAAPVSQPV